MNIQYQRNLKNSYMVAVETGQRLNMDGQLAEKMIQRQKIHGLLYWVTMEHEGDLTFWYQITGLQSLSDWLSHHSLDHKLLFHLIAGLFALQEQIPRYYLRSEHLLLQMEQIFFDASKEQFSFCYEPLWNKDIRCSLQELMEQLLPKIDHSDKKAVQLGYGLYEKCQEENADIWSYLREQTAKRDPEEPRSLEDPPMETLEEVSAETGDEEKKIVLLSEKIDFFRSRLEPVFTRLHKHDKKKKTVQSAVYSFEPEEEIPVCENPTVFLGGHAAAEGKLLYRGVGKEQSFLMEGDTFLVGNRNAQANGQIEAPGISRSHARITREGEQYYIEDLNSRNGTFLNGELLAYKQKKQLKAGDRVRFAREEYEFY